MNDELLTQCDRSQAPLSQSASHRTDGQTDRPYTTDHTPKQHHGKNGRGSLVRSVVAMRASLPPSLNASIDLTERTKSLKNTAPSLVRSLVRISFFFSRLRSLLEQTQICIFLPFHSIPFHSSHWSILPSAALIPSRLTRCVHSSLPPLHPACPIRV